VPRHREFGDRGLFDEFDHPPTDMMLCWVHQLNNSKTEEVHLSIRNRMAARVLISKFLEHLFLYWKYCGKSKELFNGDLIIQQTVVLMKECKTFPAHGGHQ
jgi:hypothetical protein